MLEGPVAIILAAGQGTRMKSGRAKVLHEVCGRPMIEYVVEAARGAGARSLILVVGHGADEVRRVLGEPADIHYCLQEQRLGTGHAAKVCRPLLEGYHGPVLILVGDEPLLRPEPLASLLDRQAHENVACVLGTAVVDDPRGFGRVLRDTAGHFLRIVEQKDCDPDEARVREINPSCYVFQLPLLWEAIDRLKTDNAQKELYLTDAPAILKEMGHKTIALEALEADDVLGINTQQQLAQAHAILQGRIHERLMNQGVTIFDPTNTYIDGRAEIGPRTEIFPFTVISGHVRIGQGCRVGPFAHLRDGTHLDDHVETGAFVEISRSHLESNTRVRHLAYLGNASVGPNVNVGAGMIIANYDGKVKHNTRIEAGAQLGAGAVLIAPVHIGANAVVGAGAVVTRGQDVEDGSTVVGVPARKLNA